jgi:pimeloyl-ACP methyl ester carboxylesterase
MATNANELLNGTTLIDDLAVLAPIGPNELRAIQCPVLAVYGESSELVGAAADIARCVPECTVRVLPGLAHTVLTEATADLRDAVLDWLGALCA